MNRIVLTENIEYTLDTADLDHISTFLEMSDQIKSNLGLRNQPIQLVDSKTVKANGIIGNISLNEVNLLILPKFKDSMNDMPLLTKEWIRRLYLRILRCSQENLSSTIYFTKNQIVDDDSIFIDVIAEYFIRILSNSLKKSHITTYEERIEKISAIRGKILIQEQLSRPITDSKTWCKYKKMSRDNIYNQLLGWTCHYLYNATSNVLTKKKLRNLAKEFPDSSDFLTRKTVSDVKLPRNFNIYNDSIQLAKSLYLGNAKLREKLSSDGNKINGYVINMEKAFENIVRYYTRKASLSLRINHKAQSTTILATNDRNQSLNYHVRPDDLILYKNKKLILDAKYKLVSEELDKSKKPKREDIYQMISSCLAYNTWEAMLIYPEHEQEFDHVWEVNQEVNGNKIKIAAHSIDINKSDIDLIEAISSIIKNTNFYSEVKNETELLISV